MAKKKRGSRPSHLPIPPPAAGRVSRRFTVEQAAELVEALRGAIADAIADPDGIFCVRLRASGEIEIVLFVGKGET